ncbi:histidine kinase [Streptomonospora nanhaiensis]|uniref:histidine kinase n=1 Tax=Streptomonospora nanhaiensis TaxID=1323731 RepID=A0ABY6YTM8_9ACTN|nr:histidine kinase [Streptomonospora nanhaiensis]WAE75754.1 histidine kinase [Streptomonospora nanhaiensis]
MRKTAGPRTQDPGHGGCAGGGAKGRAARGALLSAVVLASGLSCLVPLTAATALAGSGVALAAPALAAGWNLRGRVSAGGVAVAFLIQPAAVLALGQDATSALARGVLAVVCVVLPWLVGRYLRVRSDSAGLGWRRAELLERERSVAAERERVRERERIAARMHDSLGHELSLIAVRAGALEVAPGLGAEDYRRGVAELGAGAIGAVERLQEIIGLLQSGDAEPAEPGTGDGDLAGLVGHARNASLEVGLAGGRLWEGMPAEVRALVYAVVREGLTNSAKHAPGAPVAVRVDRLGTRASCADAPGAADAATDEPAPGPTEGYTVSVVNGPATEAPVLASGGSGLAALHARVRAAGGTLDSGPTRTGGPPPPKGAANGFTLTVRLPVPPASSGPVPHAPGSAPEPLPSAPESARQRERSRSRTGRALAAAVAVPAALLAALAVLGSGYYALASARAVLAPADFAALRVGDPRSAVAPVLPPSTMLDPPSTGPVPSGWTCDHYRSRTALPGSGSDAYRLCFAQGRLVDKDAVPTGSGGGTEDQGGGGR